MSLQQTGSNNHNYIQQRLPDMSPVHSSYGADPMGGSSYTSPQIPPNPLATLPLTNQTSRASQGVIGQGVIKDEPDVEQPPIQQQQQQEGSAALANTKEKTPMCLINELARYNKIIHQYTLVDEQGPAHKKTFYVKLKLGEEEYASNGPSIKKAQHSAAEQALEKTSFTHPLPKPTRPPNVASMTEMELNALAMKRGEAATYKPIEPRHSQCYSSLNFDYRGMYNQRYHSGRMPRTFYASLKVGQKEFIGEGPTRQAARHNAAAKALRILRNMSLPPEVKPEDREPTEENSEDQLKSEISLVHEIALKRNLSVEFEVTRESGPPHMKTFVTKCKVGEFVTEAEGNSKKLSKKRTAEMMLDELRKLPPLPAVALKPKIKQTVGKKKNRNLIKLSDNLVAGNGSSPAQTFGGERADGAACQADPGYGNGINPISRLIQIMQAQKKKEPVYSLVAERGLPRRREFVMQVLVEEQTCSGVGPNKKLAKRTAAEAMLQQLGYSRPSPQPAKPTIKSGSSPDMGPSGDKRVTFSDNSQDSNGGPVSAGGKGGRQLVPGLLLLPQAGAGGVTPATQIGQVRPEVQLRELATRHKFQVQFDDFSGQSNSKEVLSRLTLTTNPPQVLHGSGSTPEASRDVAALSAVRVLHEMGILVEEVNTSSMSEC